MSNSREDQNSSCALFLSIIFVLMLFGSGGKDPSRARDAQATTTTTIPPYLVNSSAYDPYNTHHYGSGGHSRTQSAKVVVLLFGTLMIVQMMGFAFVIALRRRALQQRAASELYSGTQISRGDGWAFDEDDGDLEDVEAHPVIASLNAAAEDPELPSYAETIECGDENEEDPGLPSYDEVAAGPPVNDSGAGTASDDTGGSCEVVVAPAGNAGNGDNEEDEDLDDIGDDVPLITRSGSSS